jgi:thymidine phosphorylase
MVELAGLASDYPTAEAKVRMALATGAGVERFRAIIQQQGGDPRVIDDYDRLPAAPHRAVIRAKTSGIVFDLHAGAVGQAATVLGAGRDHAEQAVDHGVGVWVQVKPGDPVQVGDVLFEVLYREAARYHDACVKLENAVTIRDHAPPDRPLILETVT